MKDDTFNDFLWRDSQQNIDWQELSHLYKIAPLGDKNPHDLEQVFSNSLYKCFVFDGMQLIAAGRVLADGVDCAYICDIAVHPQYQSRGIGQAIISRFVANCRDYKKIILYAYPGRETFCSRFGFRPMRTAMAIFQDQDWAAQVGLIEASKEL